MVVFLYLAFRNIEFGKTLDVIKNTSVIWLFIYLLVFMLSHYFRALRWQVMIESVKKNTSIVNLFGATMIGYGVNCVFSRLGEIYRPSFLGRWENISRSAMFGTIIVERIIDVISLGLCVIVSGFLYHGSLYEDIPFVKPALIIGTVLIILAILIIFFVVRYKEPFYKIIINIISRFSEKLSAKFKYLFEMLVDGFATIKTFRAFFMVIIYSIAIVVFYGLNTMVGFYVLGIQNSFEITFAMSFIVMSISSFGIVVPTPNGAGSYHVLCILILSKLGMDEPTGAAYALVTHFVSTIAFIGVTIVALIYINNRMNPENKADFVNVFKVSMNDEKYN